MKSMQLVHATTFHSTFSMLSSLVWKILFANGDGDGMGSLKIGLEGKNLIFCRLGEDGRIEQKELIYLPDVPHNNRITAELLVTAEENRKLHYFDEIDRCLLREEPERFSEALFEEALENEELEDEDELEQALREPLDREIELRKLLDKESMEHQLRERLEQRARRQALSAELDQWEESHLDRDRVETLLQAKLPYLPPELGWNEEKLREHLIDNARKQLEETLKADIRQQLQSMRKESQTTGMPEDAPASPAQMILSDRLFLLRRRARKRRQRLYLVVFSHHRKLFYMIGTKGRIYRSLVRINTTIQSVKLNHCFLTIDLYAHVENNYHLCVGQTYLSVRKLYALEQVQIPVYATSLGQESRCRPECHFVFHIPVSGMFQSSPAGKPLVRMDSNGIFLHLNVEGEDVPYHLPLRFDQQQDGKKHQNKEYFVPMQSIFSHDCAVQVRRSFNGDLILVKRPMEPIEHRPLFRLMESKPVSRLLFYSGKMLHRLRKKQVILFYEKLASKAEEGTFELFQRCDVSGLARCYYIITGDSEDYPRIRGYRHVVRKFSLFYYYLIFNVNWFVSTEAPIHLTLMDDNNPYVRLNLCKHPFVFLQHGVTYMKPQSQRSTFIKGKAGEPTYVVVNSEKEGRVMSEMLGISQNQMLNTGMLIFDNCAYGHINQSSPDKVIIMLTWKPYENFMDDFESSTYFRNVMEVYELLTRHLNPSDIVVVPHPKVAPMLMKTVLKDLLWDKPISDALVMSKLLITDYSSVCYNSFYQGGSVVFYQPDLRQYERYMEMPLIPQEDEYIGYRAFAPEELEAVLMPGLEQGIIDLSYFRTAEFERRYSDINEFQDGKNLQRVFEALIEKKVLSRTGSEVAPNSKKWIGEATRPD